MIKYIQIIKNTIQLLKNGFNNEPLLLVNMIKSNGLEATSFSIKDFMDNAMLWAVKKRPTIERRLKARFGHPNYPQFTRLIRSRNDLMVCETCGDYHEVFAICRTCYKEVKEETNKIRNEISEQTNPLEPKEKDICIKYTDDNSSTEDASKFRIVELARPRPAWFAQSLMTKNEGVSPMKSTIFGNDTQVYETETLKKPKQ